MSLLAELEQGWGDPVVPRITDHPYNKQAKAEGGHPALMNDYVAHSPWVADVAVKFGVAKPAFLDPRLCDLAHYAVALDNACRHCYGAARTMLRILGFSEEQIEKMEHGAQIGDISPREQLAIDYARRVSRSNPRPFGETAQLKAAGYTTGAIGELAVMAASGVIGSRIASALAIPPDPLEALADKWFVKAFRPLFASMVRTKLVKPQPMPAGTVDSPCGPVLMALDGSPLGLLMKHVFDSGLRESRWPMRTRLLTFAVVGRSLGCKFSEDRALAMLEQEGLTREQTEAIIVHLDSPLLTPAETKLLDLARETVRAQGVPLQRKVREFAKDLTPEQIVDAVGLMASANGLARLSVVLEMCEPQA